MDLGQGRKWGGEDEAASGEGGGVFVEPAAPIGVADISEYWIYSHE